VPTKKPPAPKKAAAKPVKKPAAKKPAAKKPVAKPEKPAMKFGPRADKGAPIDGFAKKQPAALRGIVEALIAMVREAAPEATSSLKWGMPFFAIGGETLCAVAAHKSHVNLILPGPEGTYPDPDELLEGQGKTGRHLKLTPSSELPRAAIRGWLAISAKRAT
jgi:hypothetical protein